MTTQQTFYGATIIDFNCNLAFRGQGSSMQISLIEDNTNVRSGRDPSYGDYNFKTDDKGLVTSIANDDNIPSDYLGGDQFYFPALGNVAFFKFDSFEFNGILKSVDRNISAAGGITYTVTLDDAMSILDGVQIILGDFIGMGEPTWGWNPRSYNYTDRGPSLFEGGALNDPTHNFGSSASLVLGGWNPLNYQNYFYNVINPYGYVEQRAGLGSTRYNFDGTLTGMDQAGMNWMVAMENIVYLINNRYRNPASQFGGCIKFAGSRFHVDLTDLGKDFLATGIIPTNYRFSTNSASLLDIIQDVCTTGSSDFYLTIIPNGGTDPFDNAPLSGTIKVNVVQRTSPPESLTVIQSVVDSMAPGSNLGNSRPVDDIDPDQKTLISAKHGRELVDDATGKVLIGGKQSRLAVGFSVYQVWATETTAIDSRMISVLASTVNDESAVSSYIVGFGNYPYTVREMRHALAGKDSWESFINGCRTLPNKWNPGGRNMAAALGIGSSFTRMNSFILNKLSSGEMTPHGFAGLSREEQTNQANDQNSMGGGMAGQVFTAVQGVANEYYGKQLAGPLPLMVKGYGEIGQRINTWEIVSSAWTDGGVSGRWDGNLSDDKGRIKPFVTYPIVAADFGAFGDDDFVYPSANAAMLVNLNVDTKVYDAGIHNFALIQVSNSPTRLDGNMNGVWESIDKAFGTNLQYQVAARSIGSDSSKYAIAPSKVYPVEYAVPQESRYHCYGPWAITSPVLSGYGKVELEIDSDIKPENYAGTLVMDKIALARVGTTACNSQQAERGSLTFTGGPKTGALSGGPSIASCNLGKQMFKDGPYVTGLSCKVSAGDVQTTYEMATWKVGFGKLVMFHEQRIRRVIDNKRKAAKMLRELYKVAPPGKQVTPRGAGFSASKRFSSSTSHPYITHTNYQVGSNLLPYVAAAGNDEIRGDSRAGGTVFSDWSAVVRGFGAAGAAGGFPGVTQVGRYRPGDFQIPQTKLNHFYYDQSSDGHDIPVVRSDNDDPRIEIADYGGNPMPIGLRGPLMLVGWGYDTCDKPVPRDEDGFNFLDNHRRRSDTWKAGPVELRWNPGTGTWIPPPEVVLATAEEQWCVEDNHGSIEVRLEACINEGDGKGEKVDAYNPLDIPIRISSKVLLLKDSFSGHYTIIQASYYKQANMIVCDVDCCDDGALAVAQQDMFIQWNTESDSATGAVACDECPDTECAGAGGDNGNGNGDGDREF